MTPDGLHQSDEGRKHYEVWDPSPAPIGQRGIPPPQQERSKCTDAIGHVPDKLCRGPLHGLNGKRCVVTHGNGAKTTTMILGGLWKGNNSSTGPWNHFYTERYLKLFRNCFKSKRDFDQDALIELTEMIAVCCAGWLFFNLSQMIINHVIVIINIVKSSFCKSKLLLYFTAQSGDTEEAP